MTVVHHVVHTSGAMSRKTNTAVGIRIPNDLLALISAEAEASDMSRNELIIRRLRTSFSRVLESQKTAKDSRKTRDDEPLAELH